MLILSDHNGDLASFSQTLYFVGRYWQNDNSSFSDLPHFPDTPTAIDGWELSIKWYYGKYRVDNKITQNTNCSLGNNNNSTTFQRSFLKSAFSPFYFWPLVFFSTPQM